jgi:hypothetical protein
MKTVLSLLISSALCCAASVASAQALAPSQVASISSDDVAWGDSYLTFNWDTGSPQVGLLQFDLSNLGTTSVAHAQLDLFHQFNAVYGAVFVLYANTSAWSSDIAQWSDRPAHGLEPVAQLTIDDSAEGVWRSFDVTTVVNSWISGTTPNYGFTLARLDNPNPYAYISSTDLAGGAAPVLTLTPVPEPATAAMLAIGFSVLAWRRRSVAGGAA